MFHSATIRLTAIYIAALAVVCIFFSYNWYQVATVELRREHQRKEQFLEGEENYLIERGRPRPQYLLRSNELLEESIANIRARIIISNIIILTIGGFGSYYLARKTLEPIEKAHEQQKQFTANASHELRTPLAAMQTEIEVALRDKKLTKDQAVELLESNLEELQDMTSLSGGLLMLARQDASDNGIVLKAVSFNSVLKPALDKVKPLAKRKSISITKSIEDKKVMVDKTQLSELLVILLENAIKYSEDGQKIRIEGKTAGVEEYRVSVIDEGIGIKAKDQVKIFDRFYRADSSRSVQNTNGHGLGLSIAQTIAKNHHGEIEVESNPGEGSTFSFELKTVKKNSTPRSAVYKS